MNKKVELGQQMFGNNERSAIKTWKPWTEDLFVYLFIYYFLLLLKGRLGSSVKDLESYVK